MKNNECAILLAIIAMALLIGCGNTKKQEEEVGQRSYSNQTMDDSWDDFQRQKDSLWTVFDESTDEAEVEKARKVLFEMADQADLNRVVEKDSEKYKDRVEGEFQQLVEVLPEYKNLFLIEKEKWEHYHEAVLAMISLEDHGSSGYLNIIGALDQSIDLWSASFHDLLLYKQDQDVIFSHKKFTSRMIDDAYTLFFNVCADDWYNIYTEDHKEGLEEYKESISNEIKMWDDWMGYRATVSKALPIGLRKIYDGCTNLTMRTKLHQLKNQNQGLGLINDDMDRCLLSDSCTDKELLEYPGFNVVWDQYLDSLEVESKRQKEGF